MFYLQRSDSFSPKRWSQARNVTAIHLHVVVLAVDEKICQQVSRYPGVERRTRTQHGRH